MSKIIEAKAVISAADKTGSVFDKIAAKFKGIEKNAKALEGISAPKFTGDLYKELDRLKLTERELQNVRKEYAAFEAQLKSFNPRVSHYMRAVEDWKSRTVNHWREVKASAEEAHKSQKRYFEAFGAAGHFGKHAALHAIGAYSLAYGAGHVLRSGAEAYGERGRAYSKYEMMGLTETQQQEGLSIASAISSKFPSISRTEALDFLRSNASRLGSWERSKEVAEPYARALIANKLSGGDEHEMEQIVRALEGMGKANTPGQITEGLNAFARAKAANPDYTGEQFRSDMAAASSSKYGLSKDYMENVFPILASHTTGFGNKMATGLSALVGGRMTKQAKARLQEAGLLDKDGKLVDEAGYIANNFKWTQEHVRPLLEKQGVKFSEDMSEEDKSKVVSWLAKRFSARNAADLMATNLLDAPLVEKARERRTVGLDAMDTLQRKDPILMYEGIINQLKDAALAMGKLGLVLNLMNDVTNSLSNIAKTAETGKVPENTNLGRWLAAQRDHGILAPAENVAEDARRANLRAQLRELDSKLGTNGQPGWGLDDATAAKLRLEQLDRQIALDQSENQRTMPPIFTDADVEKWREEDARANASHIPLPRARPAEADQAPAAPPVQPLDEAPQRVDVQGTVEGEAKLSVEVKPSTYFEAIVQKVENAIKLVGSLNTNGPGSNGRTSPDANAPAVGFNGVP
jgi:hypothetical protein